MSAMKLVMIACATSIMCSPSVAAVRICGQRVQSDVVVASTELEGKKRALEQWRAQAAKLGPGYDGWHLAGEKALKCFRKDGGFECMAVGLPCVIQQNPKQRPSGPDRKGQPL